MSVKAPVLMVTALFLAAMFARPVPAQMTEVTLSMDGTEAVVEDGFLKAVFIAEGARCSSLAISANGEELAGSGGLFVFEEPGSVPPRAEWKLEAQETGLKASFEGNAGLCVTAEWDFSNSPLLQIEYRLANKGDSFVSPAPALTNHLPHSVNLAFAADKGIVKAGQDGKSSGPPAEGGYQLARPWYAAGYRWTLVGFRLNPGPLPRLGLQCGEGYTCITTGWPAAEIPPGKERSFCVSVVPLPSGRMEGFRICGVGRAFMGGVQEFGEQFKWRVVPFLSGEVKFVTHTYIPGRRLDTLSEEPVVLSLRRGRRVEGVIGRTRDEGFLSTVEFGSETMGGQVLACRGRLEIAPSGVARLMPEPRKASRPVDGLAKWANPYYWKTVRLYLSAAGPMKELLLPGLDFTSQRDASSPADLAIIDLRQVCRKHPFSLRETLERGIRKCGTVMLLCPSDPGPMDKKILNSADGAPLTVNFGKDEAKDGTRIDKAGINSVYPLRLASAGPYRAAAGSEVLLTAEDGSPLMAKRDKDEGLLIAAIVPPEPSTADLLMGGKDKPALSIHRDYRRALISRMVLYAAGMEPEVRMQAVVRPLDGGKFVTGTRPHIKVDIESTLPAAFEGLLEFRIRNRWGEVTEEGKNVLKIEPGRSHKAVDCLYPVGGGQYFADVWIKHRDYVVNWTTLAFEVQRTGGIDSVTVKEKEILVGKQVTATAVFHTLTRAVVRLVLEDAGGAVLHTEERLVEPTSEGRIAPMMPVGLPDTPTVRLRASILVKGVEMDRAYSSSIHILER